MSSSSNQAAASETWLTARDASGRVYYYTQETQVTQWERPDGFVDEPPPPPPPLLPPPSQPIDDASSTQTFTLTQMTKKTLTLTEYQNSQHWDSIKQVLDQLKSSDFQASTLQQVPYKGVLIPQVKNVPSLLLYGLTALDRYNGVALSLLEIVGGANPAGWLLLQAVSGAGKTRAIFDVFANSTLDKSLLYFDLSGLFQEGMVPVKNFEQDDVQQLGILLDVNQNQYDRAIARRHFKALVAARHMVIQYLRKNKSWNAVSLLFAQLALPRDRTLCQASKSVFTVLADYVLLDYNDLSQDSIVAIDETNVALHPSLGSFKSKQEHAPNQPYLCCIGDAMKGWTCVFSGTSFSHDQFDQAVISNVAGTQTPQFSSMTKMDSVLAVMGMMSRFNIDVANISVDTMELLTGRCRIVANAIVHLIIQDTQSRNRREQQNNLPPRHTEEVILDAIRQVQADLSEQMKKRISKDAGSKATVEDIFVQTLLDKPKQYKDLSASGKEWADKSFVWVSGQSQSLLLNEPILVRAARDAYGQNWDTVEWLVKSLCQI